VFLRFLREFLEFMMEFLVHPQTLILLQQRSRGKKVEKLGVGLWRRKVPVEWWMGWSGCGCEMRYGGSEPGPLLLKTFGGILAAA
jgi:hypothetical protein